MKTALLLIDLQNDFLPGGNLAVGSGDETIAVANQWLARKGQDFDLAIASQDWHPALHGSFASNQPGKRVGEMGELGGLPQVMWPDHCVQGSFGAEFAKSLNISMIDQVIRKGTDIGIDSYSAFFDNGHRKETHLNSFLRSNHVNQLLILGLATDYCVKFTVLDALELKYEVKLIEPGCRAVNLRPDDGDSALREMALAGAQIINR